MCERDREAVFVSGLNFRMRAHRNLKNMRHCSYSEKGERLERREREQFLAWMGRQIDDGFGRQTLSLFQHRFSKDFFLLPWEWACARAWEIGTRLEYIFPENWSVILGSPLIKNEVFHVLFINHGARVECVKSLARMRRFFFGAAICCINRINYIYFLCIDKDRILIVASLPWKCRACGYKRIPLIVRIICNFISIYFWVQPRNCRTWHEIA